MFSIGRGGKICSVAKNHKFQREALLGLDFHSFLTPFWSQNHEKCLEYIFKFDTIFKPSLLHDYIIIIKYHVLRTHVVLYLREIVK